MRKIVVLVLIFGVLAGAGWVYINRQNKSVSPKSDKQVITKVMVKNTGELAKYNFANLKKRENKASKITKIGRTLVVEEARKELIKRGDLKGKSFDFETWAINFESNGKKISGMMNLPIDNDSRKKPAIIMIRGFAENQGYFIGYGSWKMADELARNGFVTVSLDFLGYGLSEQELTDILEARFEKPMSVMDLIESVKNLEMVDPNKIGIWAHSNGGQIAISVLEATGGNYPTALWAPMTNPFPSSVLDMVDDTSESSLKVRERINDFEKEYDSKLYSIDNYYNDIQAPILLHQGTADVWCKVEWQRDLESKLKALGKDISLDIRQDNDHNLKQSWDEVAAMDVKFYRDKFGN